MNIVGSLRCYDSMASNIQNSVETLIPMTNPSVSFSKNYIYECLVFHRKEFVDTFKSYQTADYLFYLAQLNDKSSPHSPRY